MNIDGVHVLNATKAMVCWSYGLCIIVAFSSLVVAAFSKRLRVFVLAILLYIVGLTIGNVLINNNIGVYCEHIEYEVTIDDSVNMDEFTDKYEIIEQRGKIYVVREKE